MLLSKSVPSMISRVLHDMRFRSDAILRVRILPFSATYESCLFSSRHFPETKETVPTSNETNIDTVSMSCMALAIDRININIP